MAIGAADIHKAVVSIWYDHGLDWEFKKNWSESQRDEFLSLEEVEAGENQPWPYCVYEPMPGTTTARMSGGKNKLREIRDIEWEFRVHAKTLDNSSKAAKDIAEELVDKILQHYGGHPTVAPKELSLDNGNFLLVQYQNDYSVRQGSEEYMWIIRYLLRTDVPVIT